MIGLILIALMYLSVTVSLSVVEPKFMMHILEILPFKV